jgi:hypothetical protein
VVAYAGDERIALAESQEEVMGACRERRVGRNNYYIGCVTYYGGDNEEIDFGFHEFEDVPADDSDSPNTSAQVP